MNPVRTLHVYAERYVENVACKNVSFEPERYQADWFTQLPLGCGFIINRRKKHGHHTYAHNSM